MNAKDCEREVLIMFENRIKQSCSGRWTAIEEQDRISEASLVFLSVLRTPNLSEEKLWPTYVQTLDEHMLKQSQKSSKERFHFSLDAPIKRNDGGKGSSYIDFLPDQEKWKSQRRVEHFLLMLPETERRVCVELISDPSCRKAAYRLQMPLDEIRRLRGRIMRKYVTYEQGIL